MDAFRIHAKIYLAEPAPLRDFVPALHRLIQTGGLAETMIDVTDYSHVHRGPGVGLICHQANYFVGDSDGRLGLAYARKRPDEPAQAAGFEARLTLAVRRLLACARTLEEDPGLSGRVTFRGDALRIAIADRLLAPNERSTMAAVGRPLSSLATRLWPGATVTIDPCAAPKEPFAAKLASPGGGSVADLIDRLG